MCPDHGSANSFVDLTAHLAAHSVEFARARILVQPSNEFIKWTTPLRTAETCARLPYIIYRELHTNATPRQGDHYPGGKVRVRTREHS